MSSIRSPWETNYVSDEDLSNGFERGGGVEHRLLGSLIERSTSAPPLSSEGDLHFGHGGKPLFGRERDREQSIMEPLYEDRRRDDRGTDTFLARPQAGRASAGPSFAGQPDFTSLLPEGLGTESSPSRSNQLDIGDSFSRAGAELIRSQSAAPALHSRTTLFPPPGLGNIKETTPSTADSYSSSHSGSHNFESAVEHRGTDIMQLGQRRPASTGVIGGEHNLYGSSPGGGGAVRPSAKTLMDLIQEENTETNSQNGRGGQDNSFDSYSRDQNSYGSRLSQGSPHLSMNSPASNQQQFTYGQQPQQQQPPPPPPSYMQRNDPYFSDRLQQPPLRGGRDPYEFGAPVNEPMRPGQHQYVTLQDHGRPAEPRGIHGGIYAPAGMVGHPGMHRSPSQSDPQQQFIYDGQPQHVQMQGTPVLAQNGQTVFLQAPGAPYGYATVQYHPHQQPQQPQIIRQQVPGRGHPGEQYISVVPIQGGAAQVIGGAGQQYAFWQPDGSLGMPQVTIMNATGPGGAPMRVAVANPQMEPAHGTNGYGGRGKDKGGKGRRGGPPSNRRGDGKHSPHSTSSPLLDEFRATKSRDWTVRDIEGHVVEFCQDQNGSRFIQQRLEIGDSAEQKVVMNEVLPAIHRLRNDVFGNYVVQKLLEFGSPQMKSDIRDTLQGEMLQLSLQMYGCRVVQKAFEALDEDDLPRLLREFHHNVLSCIHDQNGNHVIQKCIEVMSNKAKKASECGDDAKAEFLGEQIDFIVDDVLGNTASLSCHPYGCRVLQRILEHCVESKKTAALDEISKCHKTLLDDQYGNYVIQHVLQFGRHEDRESILQIVVENGLLTLSKQKFASNVVEKLLKYGTAQQRKAVVREMLKVVDDQTGAIQPPGSAGSSVVLLMVRDAYANYVVQTTLDVVPEGEEKRMLLNELNAHAAELRNYTFAKHIMTKLNTTN